MPDRPRSASIAGHLFHAILVPFPTVCFIGALVTDITYANTADMQWANFSVWLLVVGLVTGGLAVVAGLVELVADRTLRGPAAWIHSVGNIVVLLLAFWNVFVHSRDAWTSVVPTGLTLSIVTVVVMLVVGWLGGTLVHRRQLAGAQ